MKKVLIAPAPLKEIESVYAPILRSAGYELVFPRRNVQMTEAELLEQLPGCVASLAGSEPYTPAVLAAAAAKGLKAVCRAGVGYDGVNVPAATANGIAVTIAPGTNQEAVAEHAFMLMLALAKNLLAQDRLTREGKWPRRANLPLRGKTLGIAGFGRTGKAVAVRGLAFGMKVIAHDPLIPAETSGPLAAVPMMSFEEILQQSDFVSLHMPLMSGTEKLINARTLTLMKPTAFLINTARGGVVDEPALFEALKARQIAGAGLDVFEEEPLPASHPFNTLENAVLTAHTAGVDLQSRNDMASVAAQGIVRLLSGDWPEGWVVNPEVRAKFEAR